MHIDLSPNHACRSDVSRVRECDVERKEGSGTLACSSLDYGAGVTVARVCVFRFQSRRHTRGR